MDLSETRTAPGAPGGATTLLEPGSAGTATLERTGEARLATAAAVTNQTTSQELDRSEPASGEASDMTPPELQRSNLAIWLVLAGVALSVVLGMAVGARAGAIGIGVVLVVCAIFRAVLDSPVGLVIRTRTVDIMLYGATAVLIGVLAVATPSI
ncbi:DUF3017 domain-containing protein [Promicromonospora soli]|uniref:DUF3017 family protein n=1 Tax=Promicromonospora soli TaxID=2035533 RepID=A0A919FUT8_9MICO|nr:DUF3017 domain-containing protein [Promicromonospora soli]GHH72756.1 hypothetical protein GCM10017772_22830 [Promicromonospora soli]